MFQKIILLALIFIIGLACYIFGQSIPMEEQTPLFEGLRNTSAIIFGVMGAWIAILHPDSLKHIFSKNGENISIEDKNTIKLLLSPILTSTCILSIVLVVPLFIVAGKTLPNLFQYKDVFRGISFTLLGYLTLLQLWTLILSLIPGEILKRNIQKQEVKDEVKDRMFSETRKKRK